LREKEENQNLLFDCRLLLVLMLFPRRGDQTLTVPVKLGTPPGR
jgi:hypothetical protein